MQDKLDSKAGTEKRSTRFSLLQSLFLLLVAAAVVSLKPSLRLISLDACASTAVAAAATRGHGDRQKRKKFRWRRVEDKEREKRNGDRNANHRGRRDASGAVT